MAKKIGNVYDKSFPWLIVVPTLLFLGVFMYYPIFELFRQSFFDTHLAYNTSSFVGLNNYKDLFQDGIFKIALKNSVVIVLYIVPATLVLALFVALLLNTLTTVPREIFTPIYFLPVVTSMVAISVVWKWIYDPSFGLLNYIFSRLGLPQMKFISSGEQALGSIAVVQIWRDVGFYFVIFLAALKSIPRVLYEAAEIDGTNAFQRFRYVTVPMLRPTIIFVLIVSTMAAFKIFTPIQVMTDGGPGNATTVLVLYIIQTGIENMMIGYASAVSVVMFFFVMIITAVQWIFTQRKV